MLEKGPTYLPPVSGMPNMISSLSEKLSAQQGLLQDWALLALAYLTFQLLIRLDRYFQQDGYAGSTVGTVTEKEATTLTAAFYQCDVPYFNVVLLRILFGVAGVAFVDDRVSNMSVAWPSKNYESLS
ncbi:hypothetical protein BDF20DRAFT_999270 [Mycotypha africana]|uniref:uncharacterized protein n=1 Tax=Mycotypha africana TaxID=64632 RepID=UPI002300471A|nr:uncharacterized protein BDF20DRAFT_999270 [Mycotypha africana]KAI8984233.1 hypothetical protein BDF20DRAFT_999270 [Mycotypha africana]